MGIAKKLFLSSEFFFSKIEYLCYFLCLVMVSIPLCYKYLFLWDFLFIHWKTSIGVLEKGYLNIRRHPSIGVLKKQLLRKLLHTLHTFQRNIQGGVLFRYTSRPSWDCSKKLFGASFLQTGIYPSNLDVRYSAQKTQSFNWVLKLNLNVYISVCLFVFLLLKYWSSSAVTFLAG